MEERFPDIVDLKFTARMEDGLDEHGKGREELEAEYLSDFYGGFDTGAEERGEGHGRASASRYRTRSRSEICPNCGRKLVYKSGRFGRFLACPGFPECSFTMPIVVEMPGKCPACGGRLLKRTSKNGYTYYACERGRDCPWRGTSADGREIIGFMTWDVPTKDNCPECGTDHVQAAPAAAARKPFCINREVPHASCPRTSAATRESPQTKAEVRADRQEGEAAEATRRPRKISRRKRRQPPGKTAAKKPAAKKTTAKKTGRQEDGGRRNACAVTVVGAGLAGSECAWQLARAGNTGPSGGDEAGEV